MKVRATKRGYYHDSLRRIDDVFLVDPKDFSSTWMVVVPDDTPERRTSGQATIDRLHDERFAETRRRAPAVDIDTSRASTQFDPFRPS